MRIGELAKRSGVSIQALRFYEREGLLSKPARTEAGYRQYDSAHSRRLAFIKKAKSLGFSLAEIRHIIQLRDERRTPCSEVVAIARQHVAQVDAEMLNLKDYRKKLSRTLALWESGKECASADAICSLIESTAVRKERP